MVESVRHRIHAISITSGVLESIEEEEAYVLEVVKHLAVLQSPHWCVHLSNGKDPGSFKGTRGS